MTAIAIYSTDPALRCRLEQLLREDSAMTVVGVADNPSAVLRLIDQNKVDIVLADSPPREQLADWRTRHGETAFVVLIDRRNKEDSLDALYAGARAILPRSAERNEIVVAIKAVTNGLAILPRELLPTLLNGGSDPDDLFDGNDAVRALLTPRELEVLAAMADGASNKARCDADELETSCCASRLCFVVWLPRVATFLELGDSVISHSVAFGFRQTLPKLAQDFGLCSRVCW